MSSGISVSNQSSAKSIRICILITSLYGGGAERVAVELASFFSDKYESSIVTLKDATNDLYVPDQQVRKYSLGINKAIGFFSVVKKFRAFLKQERPEFLIGMMTYNSLIALVASIGLPVKVIATERNNILMSKTPTHWRLLRRLLFRTSFRVVAQTQAASKILGAYVPTSKIRVIPNAANWPPTKYNPEIRIERFCDEQDQIMLAVGRLTHQKGFDLLIDAFASCETDGWKLLIVGEGQQKKSLQHTIEALGLSKKIILVGRVGNIEDWYQRTDLFVLSSRYEGFPNVLLEAMAAGCACLSTNCQTGPDEIIVHEKNGFLTDVEGLSVAMQKMVDDENLRSTLAKNAVAVREKYDNQKILTSWENVVLGKS